MNDKIFKISKDNLQKAEYFNSLLTRWNHEEIIIIDSCPRLFRHFLNCLRYDTYEIPQKYKNNVYKLMDFYGVKYKKIFDETELWQTKHVNFCNIPTTQIENDSISNINKSNSMHTIYKEKDQIDFKFIGKLYKITFAAPQNNMELNITFNNIQIYNEKLYFAFQYDGTNFNKKLIHGIKKLEGKFKISMKNACPWVIISYFERCQ